MQLMEILKDIDQQADDRTLAGAMVIAIASGAQGNKTMDQLYEIFGRPTLSKTFQKHCDQMNEAYILKYTHPNSNLVDARNTIMEILLAEMATKSGGIQ